jgi:rubrerythrin
MNYEDILNKAEQKEIDARDYYAFLAEKSVNPYSSDSLRFLASEEEKHRGYIREFIDATAEKRKHISIEESGDAGDIIDGHVRHVEEIRETIFPHTDEPTLVQKALDMEKSSFEMYKNAEAVTDEENVKRLFTILKNSEIKHIELVSKLLEKVVRLHEEFPETRPDL